MQVSGKTERRTAPPAEQSKADSRNGSHILQHIRQMAGCYRMAGQQFKYLLRRSMHAVEQAQRPLRSGIKTDRKVRLCSTCQRGAIPGCICAVDYVQGAVHRTVADRIRAIAQCRESPCMAVA